MLKVSVILTSYNHAEYLREAIDSVLNQTFQDFELIIWDDASNDDSWQIIRSYNDSRIKAFQNPRNQGPVFGVNKAILEIATGEYIAIHHSDDVWELSKLEKQLDFLEVNQNIGAVFSSAQVIDQRGIPLTDESHFYYSIFKQANRSRHEWLRYFFLTSNALCHPSLLIRKQCYLDCGVYRDMLAQMPDFDMWIRLCAKYDIHIMEERLLKFRILDGEMNTSGNRPTTQTRCVNEHYQLLLHYKTLLNCDNVFKIFPEFMDLDRGEQTDADYVLARVCLADGYFLRQLLAIDILFDILNHSKRRQAVELAYGFSIQDFIHLTGQCDTFSRQQLQSTMRELNEQIAERDQRITELYQTVAALQQWQHELSDEIANLHLSMSWRLTKPLRAVSLWLQQMKGCG